MSDLARLPSYPSPTTLIARSGIQFLDFGFDPVRLKVREWGFHDAAATQAVDDLVQLDFDEGRGQYEVVEAGRRRAAEPNLVVTAKDALAPFLDKWVPVPFLQVRPNSQFREGPADWARVRVVDLEARYGAGYRDEQGNRYRAVLAFDTGLIAEAEGRAYLAPSPKDVTSGALFALAPQQRANHWLLRQGWMSQWLEELFRELHPRATLEEIDADIKQKPQEATARYLAFLGLLAHLRPSDRGGGRAGRQSERFLRTRAARPLASRERAHQAVRIARRVCPGLVRQEPPVAPGRPRRCLRLADHDACRSRSDAARRAPARHRGQYRHVEPQALPVGRGTADP
jgi:hypothetical protein